MSKIKFNNKLVTRSFSELILFFNHLKKNDKGLHC